MSKSAIGHNFHEDLARAVVVRESSDRSLGLALTVFFFATGIWPIVHQGVRVGPLLASAAFLLVTLIRPVLLSPLTRAFTAIGLLMSRITNPIVTTLLFLVVVAPFGWISRLFGRDPLHQRRDRKTATYWIARTPPGPPPETMSKQF
jgi:hypothetical protein